MPRIYLSPSTQESNIGVGSFGSEEAQMNKIVDLLMPLLDRDGRYEFKRNLPVMDVYQIARDSNKFKADIHVAIHSNAGGGEGTEIYAYGPGTNSERLSRCLYNQIAPLSPGKDRGIKFNKSFCEVGDWVNATSALIELGFHDSAEGATWIATSHQSIAEGLYRGICDYYGYDYPALVVEPPTEAPVAPTKVLDPDVNLVVWVRKSKVEAAIKNINELGFYAEQFPLKLRRD